MSLNKELEKYLDSIFPGLKIKKPLFYSWIIGLRFDLQPEEYSTSEDRYFNKVIEKAVILFESVFAPSEQITIIYQEYSYNKNKIRKGNYLFKQIKDLNSSEIKFKKINHLYEYNDKWNRVFIETEINKINYVNVIKAIANNDFPSRKPMIKGEIFFINKTKNIIFNMYDDRGLDIISDKKENLFHVYNTHNQWILEYDREKIEKTFKI